jgi:hypothetical protein
MDAPSRWKVIATLFVIVQMESEKLKRLHQAI